MQLLFTLSPFWGLYILILTAVTGLCLGSFLNCLAWRMAHGGNALKGRSQCPQCGHTLTAKELIPLASWLMQKGLCRSCGKKIPKRYPVVEALTALCLLALLLRYGITPLLLKYSIFTIILLTLSLVDLDTGIIPNSLLLAGVINFIIFVSLSGAGWLHELFSGIIGGLALFIPMLLLSLLMDKLLGRASMGGGDIKLFFVVGLYLGVAGGVFTVILSCVFGIIFPLVCKVRTEAGEGAFPFGPSIAAATFFSFLFAEQIVEWYMGLFLL